MSIHSSITSVTCYNQHKPFFPSKYETVKYASSVYRLLRFRRAVKNGTIIRKANIGTY
uniref:Uncharacterized protein n=1 Tax=Kuenenia stuttgartiensis TaxID=174633 RepID=Q1Q323_KUEST|nr:unknown protein [Candidatus Kuenenia stuttgartiensis]